MVKRLNSIEREKRLNNGGSRDREIDQIDYVGTKKARELNSIRLLKTPAGRSIVVDIVQSRTSPLHAQFSFDDCSVPLNFFKYITSDSSLRLSQQPYYRFFPPTEWCCLCDPLISVLVKYCRFPFLYTVTSRFSGSIIH